MYKQTIRECECGIPDMHTRQNCSCAGFCELYYHQVNDWQNAYAFTISPDLKLYEHNIEKCHSDWVDNFKKFTKHLNDCIVVLEMDGFRPHYHCIAYVKSTIGYNATLLSWSNYHNVKSHAMFKERLHYLFKDVVSTYEKTNIVPILEYSDFIDMIHCKKELLRVERLHNKLKEFNETKKALPSWMIP